MLSFFPKQSEKLLTAVTIQVCQLLIAGWHIFSFTHLGCATTNLSGIFFRLDSHTRYYDIKMKRGTVSRQL